MKWFAKFTMAALLVSLSCDAWADAFVGTQEVVASLGDTRVNVSLGDTLIISAGDVQHEQTIPLPAARFRNALANTSAGWLITSSSGEQVPLDSQLIAPGSAAGTAVFVLNIHKTNGELHLQLRPTGAMLSELVELSGQAEITAGGATASWDMNGSDLTGEIYNIPAANGTNVDALRQVVAAAATGSLAGSLTIRNYVPAAIPNWTDDTGDAVIWMAGTAITDLVVPPVDSGNPEPTYAAAGLPDGLSFAADTRTISGTPTTAGTGTITVTATNTAGSDTWTVAYTVQPAFVEYTLDLVLDRTFTDTPAAGPVSDGSGGFTPWVFNHDGDQWDVWQIIPYIGPSIFGAETGEMRFQFRIDGGDVNALTLADLPTRITLNSSEWTGTPWEFRPPGITEPDNFGNAGGGVNLRKRADYVPLRSGISGAPSGVNLEQYPSGDARNNFQATFRFPAPEPTPEPDPGPEHPTLGTATAIAARASDSITTLLNVSDMALLDGTSYILDRASDSLHVISTITGLVGRVGTATRFGVGEQDPWGLGSVGGNLYMVGGNRILYTVNPETGSAVRIGSATQFGLGRSITPTGLASIGDTLYMIGATRLYTLNRTAGTATQVSSSHGISGGGQPWGLAALDGKLYTLVEGTTPALYEIDPSTGTATRVGSADRFGLSLNTPRGLVAVGGVLYMNTAGAGATNLYSVNTTTGVATVVNPTTYTYANINPTSLAAIGDKLYTTGITTNVGLYEVDSVSARVIRVGSSFRFGVGEATPSGLTAIGDTLYMVGTRNDSLYTVDTTTGVATAVGAFSGETTPVGLAALGEDLYMVGAGTDALFSVNRTTGVNARIGRSVQFGVAERAPSSLLGIETTLYMGGTRNGLIYTVDTTTGVATAVGTTRGFGVDEFSPRGLALWRNKMHMIGGQNNTLYEID